LRGPGHLAALELRILLQAVSERMPGITLDGPVTRIRSNFINGIKRMPVCFENPGPDEAHSAAAPPLTA
jgi:cytochrome P450